jgi:hypothetical protein
MDAMAVYTAIGGAGGVMAVGIAIGKSMTTSRDIGALADKVHKLGNRVNLIPERPDEVYVRKDAIAPKLEAIDASLRRIETHQEMMAARFMNGGAGV